MHETLRTPPPGAMKRAPRQIMKEAIAEIRSMHAEVADVRRDISTTVKGMVFVMRATGYWDLELIGRMRWLQCRFAVGARVLEPLFASRVVWRHMVRRSA